MGYSSQGTDGAVEAIHFFAGHFLFAYFALEPVSKLIFSRQRCERVLKPALVICALGASIWFAPSYVRREGFCLQAVMLA